LAAGGPPSLAVEDVWASYSGLPALQGVSVDVRSGECVALIGANGAGKSTLLKSVSGTVTVLRGSIWFEGSDIGSTSAHARARRGITHVPQGRRVFGSLSVLDNLLLGAYREAARAERDRTFELVFDLFPMLAERRDHLAGTLSGGQQQMLAMGRGLMSQPRLLMLDEPSLGLAPKAAEDVFERIAKMHEIGRMSVLLVEQRAVEALEICDRGYVLEGGQIRLRGTGEELRNHDSVRVAYLGGEPGE